MNLAERAINAALKDAGLTVKDVGTIIFTSCTAPSIPSLDTRVIDKLGFSRNTRRVPIYQYGCLGGAAGLALALHTDSEGQATLLLSVELCSLLHLKQDANRSNLVGSALFADGAACVVLNESTRGLKVLGSRSNLLPDSSHLMGYDLRDDGTHLILDRELPSCLAEHVPEIVRSFLDEHDIPRSAVRSWLLHPGGPKILLALEKLLSIEREQSIASWHVLQQFGNMSSASLLFVLQNALTSPTLRRGDYCIMLGIGPGLCVELVALQLQ
jgi:alkylresorcinol/alkylpyrone synthase